MNFDQIVLDLPSQKREKLITNFVRSMGLFFYIIIIFNGEFLWKIFGTGLISCCIIHNIQVNKSKILSYNEIRFEPKRIVILEKNRLNSIRIIDAGEIESIYLEILKNTDKNQCIITIITSNLCIEEIDISDFLTIKDFEKIKQNLLSYCEKYYLEGKEKPFTIKKYQSLVKKTQKEEETLVH